MRTGAGMWTGSWIRTDSWISEHGGTRTGVSTYSTPKGLGERTGELGFMGIGRVSSARKTKGITAAGVFNLNKGW